MKAETGVQQILIRKMEHKDLASVIEIDQTSFSMPWPAKSFEFELKNNPVSHMWVAEVLFEDGTNQVIGMAVLWVVIDEAHIGTIAVHPQFRQQKVGTLLLRSILRELQSERIKLVYLEVRRSNVAAQQMYQKFGFELSGERLRYYLDNNEDALLLTLTRLETRDYS